MQENVHFELVPSFNTKLIELSSFKFYPPTKEQVPFHNAHLGKILSFCKI
jgi:hypothetical protein